MVIIPPKEVWPAIQQIRQQHDEQLRRWMPHITLLYPFAPKSSFNKVLPELAQVGWEQQPFPLELTHFRYFHHGQERYTLWLEPTPAQPLHKLHQDLLTAMPKFADTNSFRGGFSPHLSVGQIEGKRPLQRLLKDLQKDWQPLRFEVLEIALIARKAPPNDIFQVEKTVAFD